VYEAWPSFLLLYLNLKLSSGKRSYFNDIWRACDALMFLFEPSQEGGKAVWAYFTAGIL
jgi:hypothetical protein